MQSNRFIKRHRFVLLVTMLTAIAVVLAGCSSSKKSDNGTTSAAASSSGGGTSAAPTGDPFKIGFICACGTGLPAIDGVSIVEVWEKWTNTHGGINGHPVDVITAVEPGNPGVALTKVKELMGQGIVALISTDTAADAAWGPYAESQNIPIFTSPFGSLEFSKNAFSTGVSLGYLRDEIVLATKKVGASKLAVFYCAEVAVCANLAVGIKTAAAQYGGVEVVYDAGILSSAPNYTAQCLTAKSKGADAMFIASSAGPALAVGQSCAAQGYTPHQVSDDGAYSQSFAGKPGYEGFIGTTDAYPFYDFEGIPAMKTFRDAFQQYQPSILTNPLYGVTTQFIWTMGLLVTEAAVKGKVGKENPITPAAMFEGVYAASGTTLGGMVPPLTFKKGQANQNRCWFWLGIKDGKWDTPYGKEPFCADVHPAPAASS